MVGIEEYEYEHEYEYYVEERRPRRGLVYYVGFNEKQTERQGLRASSTSGNEKGESDQLYIHVSIE